jgi:flagellar hook-associated protein 3 FlgL
MFQFGTADIAQSMMLRRSGTSLRNSVAQLTEQLASGQYTDKSKALNGALTRLAHVEHGIQLSERHVANADFLTTVLSAQQSALGRLGEITQELALDFQISTQGTDNLVMSEANSRARDGFADAIGILNTKVAGRFLFSGTSGQERPFADPNTILTALEASLPPSVSVNDIQDHVNTWFASGGGFDTIAYVGGDAATSGVNLGNGISVRPELSGAEQAFRDSLAGLALGALGETLAPTLSAAQRRTLLSLSSTALFGAEASRVGLQARIGATEARVDTAKLQAEVEATTLQIARSELLAADPYETATALEAATQRLDALYMVTARLSRLSLTEYLR